MSRDGVAGEIRSLPTASDVPTLQADVLGMIADLVRDGVSVDGVGIAGMAETGAALDRDLRPLTGLIGWREQPGTVQAERLASDLGAVELFARTGLRLSPKLPVVTWSWLRDTSDVLARTRLWVGAADAVLAALTGVYSTHLTHAQRLGVLGLTARVWDSDLLAYGGLTAEQLPPIAEPMTIAGRVGFSAAAAARITTRAAHPVSPGAAPDASAVGSAAFEAAPDAFAVGSAAPGAAPSVVPGVVGGGVVAGLRRGTPVVLCGHDHLVGAWAAGVREPGQVADSLGTSEAIVTPSRGVGLDDALRREGISSGWYVDGRHGCAISGNGAAGGLVEQRLAFLGRDYDWLVRVLAGAGPPSERVVAPYPAGRQAPAPDPAVRYDPTAPADDPAEELRALVDALSLHARWMAESQTSLLGIEWHNTVAFGGPARLNGWMARKAHAAAGAGLREFAVVEGEATAAVGAALMAAEVVTGEPAPVLRSSVVPVGRELALKWNGHYWDRFHRVVGGPPPTRGA